MRAARIENGLVADLWEVPSLTAYEGITLISAPDDIGLGWSYDNGVFTAPADESTDEEKAALARKKRDVLLTQSDWTQVADAPVDQAAWAVYRQALRDIPAQEGFPGEIIWPVTP